MKRSTRFTGTNLPAMPILNEEMLESTSDLTGTGLTEAVVLANDVRSMPFSIVLILSGGKLFCSISARSAETAIIFLYKPSAEPVHEKN